MVHGLAKFRRLEWLPAGSEHWDSCNTRPAVPAGGGHFGKSESWATDRMFRPGRARSRCRSYPQFHLCAGWYFSGQCHRDHWDRSGSFRGHSRLPSYRDTGTKLAAAYGVWIDLRIHIRLSEISAKVASCFSAPGGRLYRPPGFLSTAPVALSFCVSLSGTQSKIRHKISPRCDKNLAL